MAIFKKNKKEETKKVSTQEDNELKDEISKAYDEIMSGNKEEKAEEQLQIALNNAQTESEKEYINKMITEYNLK